MMDLQIRGFTDLVLSRVSSEMPFSFQGNHGSRFTFDGESRLGLNLSSEISDNMVFASQILAKGSDSGAYDLQADWIFVTFKPKDGFQIRVGRQINPVFLFSEQIDVGFTYLWVRLPYEMYTLFPVKQFNGLGVIYSAPFGDYTLRTGLFAGGGDTTISTPTYKITGSQDDNKIVDISLVSETTKLRVGYGASNPRIVLNVPTTLASTVAGPVKGTLVSPADMGTLEFFSAGGSYDNKHIMGATEIGKIKGAGTFYRKATAMYASAGYHITERLTPYLTYAWLGDLESTAFVYPDNTVSTTLEKEQNSGMVGVNYKLNASSVIKGEYMRTTEIFVDSSRNYVADSFTATLDFIF